MLNSEHSGTQRQSSELLKSLTLVDKHNTDFFVLILQSNGEKKSYRDATQVRICYGYVFNLNSTDVARQPLTFCKSLNFGKFIFLEEK